MRLVKWAIAVGLVALGLMVGLYLGQTHKDVKPATFGDVLTKAGNTLTLAQPAFAQEAGKSFLEEEAGISLYVNAGEEIDLSKAKALYKVLEDETDSYLIGTVELSGYGEDWWPHVWIHRDGWIVVYYPKDEPTSKLMHWHGFQRDQGTITSTTLREALFSIARQLGVDMAKVDAGMRYYHWQYPDATRLLIVVDTGGTDSFRYIIPSAITVYEASASHYGAVGSYTAYEWSGTNIDGEKFLKGGTGRYILCKNLEEKHLTPSVPHTVSIGHRGGWVGIALFFLYR